MIFRFVSSSDDQSRAKLRDAHLNLTPMFLSYLSLAILLIGLLLVFYILRIKSWEHYLFFITG